MEEEEVEPLPVRLKYYTTLTLGLVSCLSCFIFFFMIPFVLEPSTATLVANFDPEPVVCKTVYVEHYNGAKNCSWSSCRHGCTFDQYKCYKIYVNYMQIPFAAWDGGKYEDNEDVWALMGIPVFVNIKACGYPPHTNCTEFTSKHATKGAYFACHYSRTDPSLVVTNYSWGDEVKNLILALIIPNLLTGVSLGVLSYWWYPGCQKRGSQYEMPPDQEDVSSQQGEDGEEGEECDEEEDEGGSEKKEKGSGNDIKIPIEAEKNEKCNEEKN